MRLALFSPLSLVFSRWRTARLVSGPCPHAGTRDTRHIHRPGPWIRWRTRQQLAQLDARQLADIGLTPAQARREIQQPFWR
ncbi:DUF1127 domain-containing protein [Salinicola corii]|uniref:DUF1127 domain-containing protein n=1 Tax=Salinicola corii TaxID=2606937 RepID=A0A640WEX0_9GAMM|nr:DUF1127 domain-containing protein [Salinicola corii]KAA0018674.1 DUF1127 domain-containing protein [Salinicola corii]